MTMKDVEKSCHCQYAKWSRNNAESTTAWIECRLKNDITECGATKDISPYCPNCGAKMEG